MNRDSLVAIIALALILFGVITVLGGHTPSIPFLGGRSQSDAAVGITIVLKDGRKIEVNPETTGWRRMIGLTITDFRGEEVASVNAYLKYKLDWEGEISDYDFEGYLKIYFDDQLYKKYTISRPSTISKNFWRAIKQVNFNAEELEKIVNYEEGEHSMRLEGYLKVTLTFTDGSTDTKEKSTESLEWTFNYVKGTSGQRGAITNFDVRVGPKVFY